MRLLMWGIGMVVSLGITAAVEFFGIGRDGVSLDPPRYSPPTTAVVTVPDSWPEALVPPADAVVTGTTTTGTGTSAEQSVLRYSVDGELTAELAELRAQVEAAGFTLVGEPTVTGNTGSFVADGADRQAVVSMTGSFSDPGTIDVNFALRVRS